MDRKRVAVAILNHNGINLIKKFLQEVILFSEDASIYLIDNASTDGSVDYVKIYFPRVKIICFKENLGYSIAYNRSVNNIDADIICFLNSDVQVTPNWISKVLPLFENKSIAVVQPKILDYNRKDYFEYAGAAGGYLDMFGYPYCKGRLFEGLEKDNGQYNKRYEIFWCTGACMFIRKDVFLELNGFDESYFAYQEEIDLCWRIKRKGYTIMYTPLSKVYHIGCVTLKNKSPYKTFLNFRNSLFTLVKNLPKELLFPIIIVRFCFDIIAVVYFLFQFKLLHIGSIIKAHFSFYRLLPSILKKRGTIKVYDIKYYNKISILSSYLFSYFGNKRV